MGTSSYSNQISTLGRGFLKAKTMLAILPFYLAFSDTHLNMHCLMVDSSAISVCLFSTESFPSCLVEHNNITLSKTANFPSDWPGSFHFVLLFHHPSKYSEREGKSNNWKYLLFSGLSLVPKKETVCLKADCL